MREATDTPGKFHEVQRPIVKPLFLGAGKKEGEKKDRDKQN